MKMGEDILVEKLIELSTRKLLLWFYGGSYDDLLTESPTYVYYTHLGDIKVSLHSPWGLTLDGHYLFISVDEQFELLNTLVRERSIKVDEESDGLLNAVLRFCEILDE